MTKRKAVDLYRYETQQKRDFRKVQHESFLHNDSRFTEGFLQRFVSEEPTPEFLVSANESFLLLISILNDEVLENIAIKKMEGFTNAELASIYGVKLRTIERRLATIRQKWILELPGE